MRSTASAQALGQSCGQTLWTMSSGKACSGSRSIAEYKAPRAGTKRRDGKEDAMSFALTTEQLEIREAVARLCQRFGDDYWLQKDTEGAFPHEFHRAMAECGWLGVAMPEEHGGSGLGITEAAVVMQAVAQSGAGFSGASAVHMNIFGLHPVVVFGNDAHKRRFLPPLIAGREKACFAVTEPDVGLNTTRLKTRAVRDGDHYVISGRKIWTSTAQVAEKMLILVRTTAIEEAARRSAGMTLYTDLDRS